MPRRRNQGEGSVFESPKGSGRWWVRMPGNGRRWKVESKEDGQKQLKQALRDLEDGIFGDDTTLAEWMDHWLEHIVKPNRRATTHQDYTWVVGRYVKPHVGRHKLAKLTPAIIRAWAAKLGVKYASATVANAFRRVRTACAVAVVDGRIRRNPCEGIEITLKNKHEPVALTIEQANELLRVSEANPLYALLYVAIATGLRRGELIGLRRQNVVLDGDEPVIRVTEQIQIVGKKLAFVPPKSKASKRDIPIDQDVVAVLREQLIKIEKHRRKPYWQQSDLVFPSLRGSPYTSRNLGRSFQRLVKLAKLPAMRFHDLRHTSGSLMLAAGSSLTDVARILGHSSPAITARVYAHSYENNQRATVSSVTRQLRKK